MGIFICLLTLLPDFVYKLLMQSHKINIYNLNSAGPYIYTFIESSIYLIVAYLECVLIATIVIAVKSVKRKVKMKKDYMIILGCRIKDDGSLTPLLKVRVDRSIAFRNEQLKATVKDLIFVPSGGKGNDEVISETDAMKRYLLEQGLQYEGFGSSKKSYFWINAFIIEFIGTLFFERKKTSFVIFIYYYHYHFNDIYNISWI